MLGPSLHSVYLEEIRYDSLGTIINKGNANFILKSGDLELFTTCRLITLLNVNYKIIAKVVALKIHLG